jgi:hypothetical protein
MNNHKKTFLILATTICFSVSINAQLFNKLKKKTMDKLEQKAEDKLVEELSEEIARRAFKPIDKAMNDMLRSSYEDEQGEEVDWEKAGEAYNDFLLGMNKQADVPANYSFDLKMDIETKDGEKEKHEMQYYFSKDQSIMGIQQDADNTQNFIVIDNKRDIIVLYTTKDGKKSAQAIPSAMKITGAFIKANEENLEIPEYSVDKTGKSKKIAGYESEEFKLISEKDEMSMYVAKDFPVSFQSTFGETYENFLPENYYKSVSSVDGMVMYSEYKSNENKKYNSTFEVKKVTNESLKIENSDYGLEPKG